MFELFEVDGALPCRFRSSETEVDNLARLGEFGLEDKGVEWIGKSVVFSRIKCVNV